MNNKGDLMASLMGGSALFVTNNSSNEGISAEGSNDGLFNDDIDFQNDPPPLATDVGPSSFLSNATGTGIFSGTEKDSLFGPRSEVLSQSRGDPSIFQTSAASAVPTTLQPSFPPPPHPSVPPTLPESSLVPPVKISALEESGLLSVATGPVSKDSQTFKGLPSDGSKPGGSGGGGLFDDIDQQEEATERQQAEAAEIDRERRLKQEAEQQQRKNDEERKRLDLEHNYQQQLQDQMQSIYLGNAPAANNGGYGNAAAYGNLPYPQHNRAQHQPAIEPAVTHVSTVFYRDQEVSSSASQSTSGFQQQSRFYQPEQPGNYTAGLHSIDVHNRGGLTGMPNPINRMQPQTLGNPSLPPPPITQPIYGKVVVSEPILIQSQSIFGISQPPHWTYQIATDILPQPPLSPHGGVWLVRRRFRHVVALEDRLREDCPGAILPPRPEKHATRALEEASTSQSVEFAMQRATELQVFLNELVQHPICYKSPVLRLFLALQDDLGTAWTECSGNAFTRLASASVGAAIKVSESTSTSKLPWQSDGGADDFGGAEDNAELLALQSSESIRMGMVQQAIPKLEGTVTLLREHAEQAGATGMELSRVVKELHVSDVELAQPFEIVATGLLRSGRRSKRLAIELAAAIHSYQHHYKLCKYEKYAFQDRKNAVQRRAKERMKADQRAAQLVMHQRAAYGGGPPGPYQNQYQQQQFNYGSHDRMAQEAATADLYANDAWNEADEIGNRLKAEVHRCAWSRRIEWAASLKIIASSMKEAATERVAIWETVHENFLQTFPSYKENVDSLGIDSPSKIIPNAAPKDAVVMQI